MSSQGEYGWKTVTSKKSVKSQEEELEKKKSKNKKKRSKGKDAENGPDSESNGVTTTTATGVLSFGIQTHSTAFEKLDAELAQQQKLAEDEKKISDEERQKALEAYVEDEDSNKQKKFVFSNLEAGVNGGVNDKKEKKKGKKEDPVQKAVVEGKKQQKPVVESQLTEERLCEVIDDIEARYHNQPDIRMARCADFLENPFRNVTAASYPLARQIAAAGGMKEKPDDAGKEPPLVQASKEPLSLISKATQNKLAQFISSFSDQSVADFFSKSLITLSNAELLTGRGPHAHIGLHIFLAAALRAKPNILVADSFQGALINLLPLKVSKAKVVLDQIPGNSTKAQAQSSAVGLHAWILCQTIRGAQGQRGGDRKTKLQMASHSLMRATTLWAKGLFRLATSHLDANVFITARTPRICETNLKLAIEVFRYIVEVWQSKGEIWPPKSLYQEEGLGTFLTSEGLLKWVCVLAHMQKPLGESDAIREMLQDAAFQLIREHTNRSQISQSLFEPALRLSAARECPSASSAVDSTLGQLEDSDLEFLTKHSIRYAALALETEPLHSSGMGQSWASLLGTRQKWVMKGSQILLNHIRRDRQTIRAIGRDSIFTLVRQLKPVGNPKGQESGADLQSLKLIHKEIKALESKVASRVCSMFLGFILFLLVAFGVALALVPVTEEDNVAEI